MTLIFGSIAAIVYALLQLIGGLGLWLTFITAAVLLIPLSPLESSLRRPKEGEQ